MTEEVVGLVLAGGRSSRMGSEKALLQVDGETLIERQLRTLHKVGIERLLLSVRRDLVERLPERVKRGAGPFAGVTLLHDEAEGLGPLAGIAAAAELLPHQRILVLAVDMPRVEAPLLERLLNLAGKDRGAAPRIEGRWEPLCAVYPSGIQETATHRLASGKRSPTGLLEELDALGRIAPLDLTPEEGEALWSWNEPGVP